MVQFWRIQMNPNAEKWFSESYLAMTLLHHQIIGVGDYQEERNQVADFKTKMQIGDIVAIHSGNKLIALVEVVSDHYFIPRTNTASETPISWIEHRRKIRLLDFATNDEKIHSFRGTLMLCVNEDKETYQEIQAWYAKVQDFL